MLPQYSRLGPAFELESDLQDTLDLHRKWLVDLNARKTQLVAFDWSDNTGAIDLKMDWQFLRKNHLFKMRWLTLLNWIVVLTLSIVLKQPPRKLEAWFVLWSFFFLKLICISITTIWSFMEYCCDVWAGARSCYLDCYICYEQLCYIYKLFYITIHPSLAAFFEVSSKCSHLKSFL